MELNGLPCHISLDYEEDLGYEFTNTPLSEPSSAVSLSSSPCASSSFGPHTPVSCPSTPSRTSPFDYGSSFSSSIDGLSFEPATPPSATSTYFATTLKSSNTPGYSHHSFPITPPRCPLNYSAHPLNSSCTAQLAPSPMDFCVFMNNLGGSQSVFSTTSGPANKLGESPEDVWSPFSEPPESPLSSCPEKRPAGARLLEPFEPIRCAAAADSEEEALTTPPATPTVPPRKRSCMVEDARRRTAVLRKAQQQQQRCSRTTTTTTTRARAARGRAKPLLLPSAPVVAAVVGDNSSSESCVITTVKSGKFKCYWEGCHVNAFQRKEHMERHVKSVHLKLGWSYCEFCNLRPFDRPDNYRTHLFLHTQKRRSGKVEYVEAAVAKYAAVMKDLEARRRRNRRAGRR